MREFLLRRRDWNTQRDRDRFRVLSVYIYIEGTCQRERDFFFYLVLNFTLIRFFLIQSVFFFFNPNPNVCLSNIAICPYFNSHLLSSMAPGIHYYFNFFPCFSLSLPRFHLFPPFFFVLSYFILLYLLIKILYYPLLMATRLSKSRFECFTSFTEESSFNFQMKK